VIVEPLFDGIGVIGAVGESVTESGVERGNKLRPNCAFQQWIE
jgi:hypothetical protein